MSSSEDSKKGGSAEGRPTRQGRRSRLGRPLGREQLLGGLPQGRVDTHILADVANSPCGDQALVPTLVVNAAREGGFLQLCGARIYVEVHDSSGAKRESEEHLFT